jgi:hypothetical protein
VAFLAGDGSFYKRMLSTDMSWPLSLGPPTLSPAPGPPQASGKREDPAVG